MARVSAVIPTHNRVDLLGRAVRSVLGQSFTDLELLIADDASTDGTGEMILSIGDPRVKYFRHETNQGVSAARNTALAHASGEFIAFLDDDDEWLPEKTQIQMDRFTHAGRSVGMLCGGYHVVDTTTNHTTMKIVPSQRGWILETLLRQGFFGHTSTIMARAECFEKVGVFDVAFPFGEDFDMWLRIAREYEADFVSAPVARRFPQANGLTQNFAAIVIGMEAHLNKYLDFFEKNSCFHTAWLRKLGVYYCFAGNTTRGRQLFYRAIAQCPLAVKSYICVALSLMGPVAFRGVYAARNRLE